MSKDKKEGKTCMIVMNSILLVIGLVVFIGMIYLSKSSNVPSVLKELSVYCSLGIVASVVLIIFSILGFCASCGGCFLFFYAVLITIMSIFFVVATISLFVVFFTMRKEDASNAIFRTINETVVSTITDPTYAADWKSFQDTVHCCGYADLERTGSACSDDDVEDCFDTIFNTVTNYSLIAALVSLVVLIVIIILNCASCKRLKSDCCSN